MSGTNEESTFKINLPCDFTTQNLALTLTNFIPKYPTGTDAGIVQVDMIGVNNPYSFSSSNMNTHRTLGMFKIEGEGIPKEYPPSAMTGNTTAISNQPYGNGTYVASVTSGDSGTGSTAFHAFDKQYDLYKMRTSFASTNFYNGTTGFYEGTANNSTVMSGSNYFGEHLTLQLPTPISLQSYSYTTNSEWGNRSGTQWVLGASTNGTDWTLLDTESNVFWNGANETKVFPVPNNTRLFNYYRMLVTRVGNSNSSSFRNDWGIAELKLYGFTNPQTSRSGQLNMNAEVITTDRSLFERPITFKMTSPSGINLTSMSDWSAEISVREML